MMNSRQLSKKNCCSCDCCKQTYPETKITGTYWTSCNSRIIRPLKFILLCIGIWWYFSNISCNVKQPTRNLLRFSIRTIKSGIPNQLSMCFCCTTNLLIMKKRISSQTANHPTSDENPVLLMGISTLPPSMYKQKIQSDWLVYMNTIHIYQFWLCILAYCIMGPFHGVYVSPQLYSLLFQSKCTWSDTLWNSGTICRNYWNTNIFSDAHMNRLLFWLQNKHFPYEVLVHPWNLLPSSKLTWQ